MKRTIVVGASPNPSRYSHKAVLALNEANYEVFALGIKEGMIGETEILLDRPEIVYVHTITIYLRAERQEPLYEYILELKPKRLIFNPGAENPVLSSMAIKKGIKVENACTLVLLRTNQF